MTIIRDPAAALRFLNTFWAEAQRQDALRTPAVKQKARRT